MLSKRYFRKRHTSSCLLVATLAVCSPLFARGDATLMSRAEVGQKGKGAFWPIVVQSNPSNLHFILRGTEKTYIRGLF